MSHAASDVKTPSRGDFWQRVDRRLEQMRQPDRCETCQGAGWRVVDGAWVECSECSGSGKAQTP